MVRAFLLVGPTGSGKSPLGAMLQSRGIGDVRCHHFDFGEHLRGAAGLPAEQQFLDAPELDVVRDVLQSGALLEDHQFAIAAKILKAFIDRRSVRANEYVIMNGLPRHVGQADDVAAIVDIRGVIELVCTPQVVHERIRGNTGGDRTDRVDDDTDAIVRKLRIYSERTVPLVDYYRTRGAAILAIDVDAQMTPADAYARIDSKASANS